MKRRVYVPFLIRCGYCQHFNRPDPNPAIGICLVLGGIFDTCSNCGTKFKEIFIPDRPLVRWVSKRLEGPMPLHIKIVNTISGNVPAFGYYAEERTKIAF